MRLFLPACALFLAAPAFAMPSIGDLAFFDATIQFPGETPQNFSLTQELLQQDPWGNDLERVTENFPGNPPLVEDNWINSANLNSDATVNDDLANCARRNGSLQTLTVPAGTFSTCKMNYSGSDANGNAVTGTVWVGKVPFGFVKANTVRQDDGQETYLSLRSFHFGSPPRQGANPLN